ncbi:stepping stone [Rhynchophorus ferrugineus]|uniref:stepping stone n=1 Tax=Rhynchophorus ferrugineus TaxID=354439 RepID=UPI003FCE8457
MEDVASSEGFSEKMGASSNNKSNRLANLQERRKEIEESLAKCTQELRQLCIQEAELTGITPPEMPLEEGEKLPIIRRKVGTGFKLSEYLLNNNTKNRQIFELELQIQVHTLNADAALGLAEDGNCSKTIKRQHRAEYQKHKMKVNELKEELALLKEKAVTEQVKQKKKPRVPDPQDDNISVITNDHYVKQDNRHTLHSKHSLSMLSPADTYPEARYSQSVTRQYRHSENPYYHYPKPEDMLTSGFYRLSLNGYNAYIERRESTSPHYNYPTQNMTYNYGHIAHQPLHSSQHGSQPHSPLLPPNSPQMSQHSPHLSQSSPHLSQNSPHLSQHSSMSQHSPQMQSHSPQLSHSPLSTTHSLTMLRTSQNYSSRMSHQYQMHRQPSPTTSNSGNSIGKVQYYPAHSIHGEPVYNRHTVDASGYKAAIESAVYRTPHSLQPHQQYEHNGMNSGLGGCWKKAENGEMFWVYSSSTLDSNWQRDKRFGSLDRRKNKRVQRRVSPVENKSATLATLPSHSDQVKTAFVKPSQIASRRSHDHRQLVRTQSLGSVGQNIDSVYPSDDTSSCESDNRSLKENRTVRKQKEKEWLETSLDGPISPTHSVISRSQSTVPTILTPEEKYVLQSPPVLQISTNIPPHLNLNPLRKPKQHLPQNVPPPLQSPISPKPPLEIPAESNPSPRVPEPPLNIEMLNNNIPKNCTIVQAGVCKPYHEETKPFEMSDFYKYSTKYKKSPQKDIGNSTVSNMSPGTSTSQKSLTDSFDNMGNKGPYPNQHVKMQSPYIQHNAPMVINPSNDMAQVTVSKHYPEEMNSWYNDQDHVNDGNNVASSKSRSNATLV